MPLARSSALALALALLAAATAGAAKKKAPPLPVVSPESARQEKIAVAKPESAEAGKAGAAFEELSFNRTIVIEGKVEKPQVTFTLLKEPPPEKELRFETSFLADILKLNRENTFAPGETYGRE